MLTTPRLALVVMPADELQAQRDADRRGRSWAEDYPTGGDVLQANLMAVGERPLPSEASPWGPLQIRELATGLAVAAILGLARRHGARAVLAETDSDNFASQQVLRKNGFMQVGGDALLLRWRCSL